jgi:diaminohydroxyphosphoribosylaminopyrimidine deaminase/5-amino-6-(5-phosphoribosylamino)uracil reductase
VTQADRDEQYMTLALRLAAKGRGRTSPNPMVGAVVVTAGGLIVGQGYHRRAGGPHAEVFALRQAGNRAAGATLYVTLEPCGHTNKRTPPCVPLIQASGVRRVVVAQVDPNPLVSGRGIRKLRAAGLRIDVGCCALQARRLNAFYSHWMETGRPFVTLKAGMTLDGKIATASGESRWITGEAARRDAHRLRASVDAVLVGIGTVLRDDPTLTARISDRPLRLASRQPIRIVVDSRLRIPLKARVLSRVHEAHTLIAATKMASARKIQLLRRQGVDVLVIRDKSGQVSLADLCRQLGRLRITSLLVEGGGTLNASLIRSNLVDRVVLYVAPLLLGGHDAKGVIGGASPKHLGESLLLEDVSIRRAGRDMVIEGDLHHK